MKRKEDSIRQFMNAPRQLHNTYAQAISQTLLEVKMCVVDS